MTAVTDHLSRGIDAAVQGLDRRFTFTSALAAFFLFNAEVALLATYILAGNNQIYDFWPMLFPFVWINVAIAAIAWTEIGPATTRQRAAAIGIGVGYFVVLSYFGGLFGPGSATTPNYVEIVFARHPPGWDPMLLASTPSIRLSLVFYKLVGYVALAYLVYATVIDAAGSAIGGIVGLFSCVSCSWPIIGSVLTGVFGGGSAIAAAANSWTYFLSTVIFVLTVALLYWRPGFDRLRPDTAE